uniref:NADH-ubiquinone oxidoreductase chain 2 n=1 Tax=Freyastera benthophila TaxID=556872 RepID=A0A451EI52_9ECHI|nr:NADH dehydrogenase subunit 2 [Freyastera benthophila]AYR06717.1 NADH dehydrogenase subunit 2 [Freyastera benthophila]
MNRKVIFLLLLNVVVGVLIVVSSHSWFTVWVGLELNTLSILCLLCYDFSPRNVESTVKYFLVQAFSAGIILNVALIQLRLYSSWSISNPLSYFGSVMLTLAISLKLGLFPCHFWFPDVIQGVGFLQGLLLSTWQKVAPFVILINVHSSINSFILISLGSVSVLIGGWGGLNQVQMRKIMAFSSISHIGWVCSVLSVSISTSCVMFIIYIILSSAMFLVNNEVNLYNLSILGRLVYYNPWVSILLILVVLSLGGLPPLTGFLSKFLALSCLLNSNLIFFSIILIFGSLLNLFFYLRIGFNSVLCLFPQHSMMLFTWRSVLVFGGKSSWSSMLLGILLSSSIFGLLSFPMFVSFI